MSYILFLDTQFWWKIIFPYQFLICLLTSFKFSGIHWLKTIFNFIHKWWYLYITLQDNVLYVFNWHLQNSNIFSIGLYSTAQYKHNDISFYRHWCQIEVHWTKKNFASSSVWSNIPWPAGESINLVTIDFDLTSYWNFSVEKYTGKVVSMVKNDF